MSISRYCYRYSLFSHFILYFVFLFFFFFQAEDGIRDKLVTGVQTCALPISTTSFSPARSSRGRGSMICSRSGGRCRSRGHGWFWRAIAAGKRACRTECTRSEERRVGKEGRSRGGGDR